MSAAFSEFDTRKIAKREYYLLADFTYVDDVFGSITAKQGFHTNFASLDSLHNVVLFPVWALVAGYGDKAATIHDWLYGGHPIVRADGSFYYPTRKECDEIFFRALRCEGIARWRAQIMYAGVRVGGKSHYASPASAA